MNVLKLAHTIWEKHIKSLNKEKICLVDATCGNGHDSLFLSNLPHTSLHLIDVQEIALQNTQDRLPKDLPSTHFHHQSHEDLSYIPEPIDLIVYNLGYLPNSSKSIITRPDTTRLSLQSALERLAPGGLISIMIYTAHPGGDLEKTSIINFIKGLKTYHQVSHTINPLKPTCPELVTLYRPLNS